MKKIQIAAILAADPNKKKILCRIELSNKIKDMQQTFICINGWLKRKFQNDDYDAPLPPHIPIKKVWFAYRSMVFKRNIL